MMSRTSATLMEILMLPAWMLCGTASMTIGRVYLVATNSAFSLSARCFSSEPAHADDVAKC